MPMSCSTMASRPEVTCSPEATMASYSRASCKGEASLHQATSSLVLPDMAETTTATSKPAATSRCTWRATLRMRSILATEVPPNFITRRGLAEAGFAVSDMGLPKAVRRLATLRRGLKLAPCPKAAYTYDEACPCQLRGRRSTASSLMPRRRRRRRLEACGKTGTSRSPSFETPAAQAPQDEGLDAGPA